MLSPLLIQEFRKEAIDPTGLWELAHQSPAIVAGLAVAKAHLLGRYGRHIPGLSQVLGPVYRGATHAGAYGALAGERGVHPAVKFLISAADPHLVNAYESGQQAGRLLRERGITKVLPRHVQKIQEVWPDVEVKKTIGQLAHPSIPNRIARALTGDIKDIRGHLRGEYLGAGGEVKPALRVSKAPTKVPITRAQHPQSISIARSRTVEPSRWLSSAI
jgi:hypothetical protein